MILKHEQGHFDIAEIFARKLHKRMKEYRFNQSTYQTDLREIYSSITAEKEAFQDLYDNETDHSRKKDVQEKWLKKISELLNDLKDYSAY
jgi:predicted secreted Zn-dependent protease